MAIDNFTVLLMNYQLSIVNYQFKVLPLPLHITHDMSILLSFIIPAYNAEPYLKECLDSIGRLNMRGRGFEIIVVNDGSTDGTAELLEAYEKTHAELCQLRRFVVRYKYGDFRSAHRFPPPVTSV